MTRLCFLSRHSWTVCSWTAPCVYRRSRQRVISRRWMRVRARPLMWRTRMCGRSTRRKKRRPRRRPASMQRGRLGKMSWRSRRCRVSFVRDSRERLRASDCMCLEAVPSCHRRRSCSVCRRRWQGARRLCSRRRRAQTARLRQKCCTLPTRSRRHA